MNKRSQIEKNNCNPPKRSKSQFEILPNIHFELQNLPKQQKLIRVCSFSQFDNKKKLNTFINKHSQNKIKNQLTNNYQSINPKQTKQRILSKYNSCPVDTQQRQIKNLNLKAKSIYQQYLERFDQVKANIQENKNPQIKYLRKENQEFKNKILEDIQRLRIIRQKSRKSLQKKEAISTQVSSENEKTIDLRKYKEKLRQKNKQKLASIK